MDETTEKRPPRNWTRWLLVASLAANVAIVGIVIGTMLQDNRRPPVVVGGNDGLRGLVRALPEDERAQLRAAARDRRKSVTSVRQSFRQTRQLFLTEMQKEDIDEAALRDVFATQAGLVHMVTKEGYGLIVEILIEMPHDERLEYLERLQNPPERERRGPQPRK